MKLLSYTSKVFFNILISKLRKIKKLFVELKQGTLKKVSSGRTSDNMIRGKKALINIVGTRIQNRKLGAATHLQASVGFSLGGRALSFALRGLGCSAGLALTVDLTLRALLTYQNHMMPLGEGTSGSESPASQSDSPCLLGNGFGRISTIICLVPWERHRCGDRLRQDNQCRLQENANLLKQAEPGLRRQEAKVKSGSRNDSESIKVVSYLLVGGQEKLLHKQASFARLKRTGWVTVKYKTTNYALVFSLPRPFDTGSARSHLDSTYLLEILSRSFSHTSDTLDPFGLAILGLLLFVPASVSAPAIKAFWSRPQAQT
ncbi:unnamed protein product [Vicia faba]|uniref:Uncharacterized protein n=1 Tax=Vicia faba TaxID=3906 RepID=A0AAV1ANP4_VICFA|nr:unnamed protein product [Vicia faba]